MDPAPFKLPEAYSFEGSASMMQLQNEAFDIAVVGGGVVGCAVARRFTLDGARVVLIERAPDILAGASKGNSALLHTGFDAPTESLELACVQAGYREYLEIRGQLNLPVLETGAMVVAWSDDQLAALDPMEDQARSNGVGDVRRLSAAEVLEREPRLATSVRGALLVPGEHVIDPWSAPLAYLTQAIENGATGLRARLDVVSTYKIRYHLESIDIRRNMRRSSIINIVRFNIHTL
jgi:glycerol-3-phosphate dehydrogenase